MTKRSIPPFVGDAKAYERWLNGRARAHAKRDRLRRIENVTERGYREAIHQAVLDSEGCDFYTGEMLDWSLCGQYNNAESKAGRHHYKARFNMMPTVDHHEAASTVASFKICAWRTNDSKHDLTQQAFLELCRLVVAHADRAIG